MKIYSINQLEDFKYPLSDAFKDKSHLKEMIKTLNAGKKRGEEAFRVCLHNDRYVVWTKGDNLEEELANGTRVKLDPSRYSDHKENYHKSKHDYRFQKDFEEDEKSFQELMDTAEYREDR